jgi:endo-1,4-beta-xylanase
MMYNTACTLPNDTMHPSRRSFTLSLATGAVLAGCATPTGGTSIDAVARTKGLRFGSTLGILANGGRPSRFHDEAYRALTARECSVLVAENETKWQQLCPDPRQPYRFEAADEMFGWARGQGMALRGHTLLWMESKWLPAWVNGFDFGARPGEAAERLLAGHVRTTCTHFGRDIESWDVVNEAVAAASGALRENVFSGPLGSVGQIDLAFRLAREHAPQAQLVYNDYMSWGADNARHRAGVLKLLAELKRRGAPVQALGVLGHIGVWRLPAAEGGVAAREWSRFLDEVMAMDLDILVTEFDVNDRALPGDARLRDAGVAAAARDWLDATLAAPHVHRLLCWGLSDRYSWLQDTGLREDGLPRRVLPYDESLQPKALRAALVDALSAMPARQAA